MADGQTRVIRLQEVEGQITCDQICVMCIPFILVEAHSHAGYIHIRRMHNNNLQIRIGGSSCHPQSKLACERAHLCELGEKI